MLARDLAERAKRVDRPRVGGPRCRDHRHRHDPGRDVGLDRGAHQVRAQPEPVVGADVAHARASEPKDAGRALDGVVGLVRRVDRQPQTAEPVGTDVDAALLACPLTGRTEGHEVGGGSTAGVDAVHVGAEPAELREPLERELLEQVERREEVALG